MEEYDLMICKFLIMLVDYCDLCWIGWLYIDLENYKVI